MILLGILEPGEGFHKIQKFHLFMGLCLTHPELWYFMGYTLTSEHIHIIYITENCIPYAYKTK